VAITFETPMRDAIANAVGGLIDNGVTETGGKLVIETSVDVEISLHRFNNPFDSGSSTGTITMSGAPKDDVTAAAGTAAQFSLFDRGNTKIVEGVVAVTGQDLDLSSLSVGLNDTVSLTAFSITMPA